jgi:hypothetical protein
MYSLSTMIERWRSEGLVLLPPEPEFSVRETFRQIGALPTSDVIAMFAMLGGMREMDRELWRLWSLSEIREENSTDVDGGVWFSDYAVSAWNYRLAPNDNDTSSVIAEYASNVPCKKVASSLEEFFNIYVEDPYLVIEGPHPP